MRDDQIEAQEATAEAQGRAQIILSKYKIKSIIGNEDYQSINTPEDYRKIKTILN